MGRRRSISGACYDKTSLNMYSFSYIQFPPQIRITNFTVQIGVELPRTRPEGVTGTGRFLSPSPRWVFGGATTCKLAVFAPAEPSGIHDSIENSR